MAGLFIFSNKHVLDEIPTSGAFVEWLQTQNIDFIPISLESCKEIGTLLTYTESNPIALTRPFNKIIFENNKVVKIPLDLQGETIAQKEIAWYRFTQNLGFNHIPEIYDFSPLTMKKIQGRNIFEYECLLPSQKREILGEIIRTLHSLHSLAPRKKARPKDCEEVYINKTFSRLESVRSLIPFANDEFIKINAHYYKNVLFSMPFIKSKIMQNLPRDFCLIHGDCTFSNMLFDTFNMRCILIDPRGYFGNSIFYGDKDYDWAKLYYSLKGNYDNFNRKKFSLLIDENKGVELAIKSSQWEDMEEIFFELLPQVNKEKIRILHALIWLSLTTYVWEDYDSICAAFYQGNMLLDGIL